LAVLEEANFVDFRQQHVAGTSIYAPIEKSKKVMKESAVISETSEPKRSVAVRWLR
jgi:hypothetical protein